MSLLPHGARTGRQAASGTPKRTLLACAAIVHCFAPLAFATQKLPVPSTHVADYANVINAGTEQQIDGYLTELEQKTGAQVLVLTVRSTDGESIEQFTLNVAEQWKLGQKGRDDGALVAVAVDDRKARVEVGYGLEGVLPDTWCGRMQREFFKPNFRKGDYSRGILDGAVAIANRIADEKGVQLTGVPATRVNAKGRGRRGSGCSVATIILILVIISMINGGGRRRRYRSSWGGGLMNALIIGSMLNRGGGSNWGGGWGGGGGFGGGGFGGGSFGGGGGGSFGGGGASSGW